MEQTQSVIALLNKELSLQLSDALSLDELKEQLATYINHLINTDFEKLVYYLYRIDVNEQKMKLLLQQNQTENAGTLLADLIISRQLEKMKLKKFFPLNNNIPDDEKW